jgi:hypothetical protein
MNSCLEFARFILKELYIFTNISFILSTETISYVCTRDYNNFINQGGDMETLFLNIKIPAFHK